MGNSKDLEPRIGRLEDIEAIKQLKHRYLRAMDTKQWDEMAGTLAENVVANYSDGELNFTGRDKVMEFLRDSALAKPGELIGVHHCQQPEIEITGPDSARGTWALYNYLIHKTADFGMRICAFYHDEYRRTEDGWRISATGYQRVFEESCQRSDMPSLKLSKG